MNAWETELVRIVAHFAPVLGTALAGPAGGMVGALISNAFNSTQQQELVSQIKSDPDAEAKLKQIEADHEIDIKKLSLQQSAIDAIKSIMEMD
jgi:hypothetical protein